MLHTYKSCLELAEAEELPQGLFGHARANELAVIDRRHQSNALIVADLSNDSSYADILHETFGKRVIGLHIGRFGVGWNPRGGRSEMAVLRVYTIGRTHLLELFHSTLQSDLVRFANGPDVRHAFEQLTNLEIEYERDRNSIHLPSRAS